MRNKRIIYTSILIAIVLALATLTLIFKKYREDKHTLKEVEEIQELSSNENAINKQEMIQSFKDMLKDNFIVGPNEYQDVTQFIGQDTSKNFDIYNWVQFKNNSKAIVWGGLINHPINIYNEKYETGELNFQGITSAEYTIKLDDEVEGKVKFKIRDKKYELDEVDFTDKLQFIAADAQGSIMIMKNFEGELYVDAEYK